MNNMRDTLSADEYDKAQFKARISLTNVLSWQLSANESFVLFLMKLPLTEPSLSG